MGDTPNRKRDCLKVIYRAFLGSQNFTKRKEKEWQREGLKRSTFLQKAAEDYLRQYEGHL
jgi:hypothetical protein